MRSASAARHPPLRDAGYDRPIYIHGALARLSDYFESRIAWPLRPRRSRAARRDQFAGRSSSAHLGLRRPLGAALPDPVSSFAWLDAHQRARQRGVELLLIISDHSDWDELIETIEDTGASEVWVTHGREEALVRWCELNGIAAKALHLVGYEDEGD